MSEYTWVVVGVPSGVPMAAFQRKYETQDWFRRTTLRGPWVRLFRLNPWNERRVELDIEEFLGEESK